MMRSARYMAGRPYGIRVSRTVWLRHELSLAHEVPRHPERPERIIALEAEMQRHGWFGCDVVRPPEATREQLLAVRPGTTPSRGGRWGSASSATRPWRRGTRRRRTPSSGF